MAFQNSLDSEVAALQYAVFFYCLDKIRRTAGIKSAGWREKRRNNFLISFYKEYYKPFHFPSPGIF